MACPRCDANQGRWWPWILSAVSVSGVIVARWWPAPGWTVCLAGEALWAVYTVRTRQWGFLPAVVFYTAAWVLHLTAGG